VLGGNGQGNEYLSSCEVYDLNEKEWKDIPDMNKPRCSFSSTVLENCIYVFGGFEKFGSQKPILNCEKYDINKGTWTTLEHKKQMGVIPNLGGASFVFDGRIYFLGGAD
jgi:N-acetylneuraminic acid mutarotase